MNRKKKCLIILPRPIFPIVSGYSNKNYNLLKGLSARYSLQAVILSENGVTHEEEVFYREQNIVWSVQKISKIKSFFHTLMGIFSRRPLQISYYYDVHVQQYIDQCVMESDICIAALIRTWAYLEHHKEDKILVFDMVDSIALNYEISKRNVKSLFWRFIYSIESKRLKLYESLAIKKSDITYLFNEKECRYWSKTGNVRLLPHGVAEELFGYKKFDSAYHNAVVFIGKMDYQPNIDAIIWYMNQVHKIIGTMVPLVIVGAYPTGEVKKIAAQIGNVTVTGYVEDPYIYLNSAMAVIAPMQTGGGIQNKVLEGMALGKVNIVTRLAAEPIVGSEHKKNILIADSKEEFMEVILDIAKDKNKYSELGMRAKELIYTHYTWENYVNQYIAGIEDCEIRLLSESSS